MALITPPPNGHNQLSQQPVPISLPPSATSSSAKKRRRRTSHMACGIGPAIPTSLIEEDETAFVNLHSNEIRTLDVAVPRSRDGGACYDSLLELDVSSNFLGDGYSGYVPPTGGRGREVQSLLCLAPNLQSLNLSANALTAESLSALLGLGLDLGHGPAVLQQLEHLDLSHNRLRHLPDIHASCPHLTNLNLMGNAIGDLPPLLRALYPLRESLTTLSLQNVAGQQQKQQKDPNINPVCSVQGYRERLISALGCLSEFDTKQVCSEERIEARRLVELGLVYGNSNSPSGTGEEVAKEAKANRKVKAKPGHTVSSRGNPRGKRQQPKPKSSAVQAVESKFDTALSRIDGQETTERSLGRNYQQNRSLHNDETGYGDDASLGQISEVSEGEAGLRASVDSLRKLNKLENRVKLLSTLAREQADATERLHRSNTAANKKAAADGYGGQSVQNGRRSHEVQQLQVNGQSHRSAARNVVRVSDASVQCTEVGNVRQPDCSQNGRLVSESQRARKAQLNMAIMQMTTVFVRSRDGALRCAFTRLQMSAAQAQHTEQMLLARSEWKQREAAAIKRAVTLEREALDVSTIQAELYKAEDLIQNLEDRISEQNDRVEQYEKDRIDMTRSHKSDMQLLRKEAEREVQECLDCHRKEERRRLSAEEERRQLALHVERLQEQVDSEREAAGQELGATRKELDKERERCKTLAAERDKAMDKAKEEALKFCDKELRQQQRQSDSKLLQVKNAFETAAKRAASDRAKCKEAEHEVHSLREDLARTKDQLSNAVEEARGMEIAMAETRSSLQTISTKYQKIKVEFKSKARLGADLKRLEVDNAEKDYQVQRIRMERDEAEKMRRLQANDIALLKKEMDGLELKEKEAVEKARKRSSADEIRIQTLAAEAERHRGVIDRNAKEAENLKSLLTEREEAIKKLGEELMSVKAAYEKKELQLIRSHEAVLDEAKSSSRQEVRSLDEKLDVARKERDKNDRRRINAEEDARELARELHGERKARLQLEEEVKSLRVALDDQKVRARKAIEGLSRQLAPPTPGKNERRCNE